MSKKPPLLGDIFFTRDSFSRIDAVFQEFHKKEFAILVDRKRSERVNRLLLDLIREEPEPCFLLGAVLGYIERIDQENVLEHYTLTSFELWLNQFSGLSFEENYAIRAKIVGKKIERSDYQVLFPIGNGKVYEGTHFVTAHKSPDLDTTVASFWGWMDAFAARVGEGLHIWNLPGGPPASQIEIELMFREPFGQSIFTHLAKTRSALTLNSNDLMSQEGLFLKSPFDPIVSIDHERDVNSVVVVDKEGFYLGDWRTLDVEGVRQVVILLSSCLRWFENQLHLQLISLFAHPSCDRSMMETTLASFFSIHVEECEPALEFTLRQKKQVHDFLIHVLDFSFGITASFDQLLRHLSQFAQVSFDGCALLVEQMLPLFHDLGQLIEDRSKIFHFLEKMVKHLHASIFSMRQRLEMFDVALKTKERVFGHHPNCVTVRSDVEEIKHKMGSYLSLTVTYPNHEGKLFPVGVIQAADLRKNFLGTVSLRDFCNRDEMTIPPYLDVISVIDHHKSSLNTFSPPMAIIADVQSSNSLVAERAFQMNDRYSLSGQTEEEIQSRLETSSCSLELMQRLLTRKMAFRQKDKGFVHPKREFIEYLHFLYAILDDTDLLTKVTPFDVDCVVSLLNRLKSLSLQQDVEILSLQDLPRDSSFSKQAAMRILRHEDMYSLYKKVYEFREKEVEKNIRHLVRHEPSTFFADTKEQNGCCRVGQTKIFANNFQLFNQEKEVIRNVWLQNAIACYEKKQEIQLYIHMVSTIVSAEEVYKGETTQYFHKDEAWVWIPEEDEVAVDRLRQFLSRFKDLPVLQKIDMELELLGPKSEVFEEIFRESFISIPSKKQKSQGSMAVLKFRAGSLNSRKAMISPYLPNVI